METICPQLAVREYVLRTKVLRADDKSFFVSYAKPYKSVTSRTLARWLTKLLAASGVDTTQFAPHATRSASAAYSMEHLGMSVLDICRRADWSLKSGVFGRFYDRCIAR